MKTCRLLLITLALLWVALPARGAASRKPDWSYYHFNGQELVSGPAPGGAPFLAVRAGVMPVVLTHQAKIEATALPPGMGAIAGLSYLQNSGGKLSGVSPFSEVRTVVRITGKSTGNAHEVDAHGYFTTVVAAGEYELRAGAATVNVVVETGRTTLTALRAGKRMVD